MNRMVLGAFVALVMVGVGLFWWQGRAQVDAAPPPAALADDASPPVDELPLAQVGNQRGPAPPEASELTREQKRFFRYDRDRNLRISRTEMLSSRTDAFRKLDVDGNNLLTFEEWAIATSQRFDGADADKNLELTPKEFATTAPKPRKTPACRC